jgi:hypothetical protein
MNDDMGRPPRKADEPETKNLTVALNAKLWERIEAYRERVYAQTTAEAVRRLLSQALEADEKAQRDE